MSPVNALTINPDSRPVTAQDLLAHAGEARTPATPMILIVPDEAAELLAAKSPEGDLARRFLDDAHRYGRAYGVTLKIGIRAAVAARWANVPVSGDFIVLPEGTP